MNNLVNFDPLPYLFSALPYIFCLLVGIQLMTAAYFLHKGKRPQDAKRLIMLCLFEPVLAIGLLLAIIYKSPQPVVVGLGLVMVMVIGTATCLWIVILLDRLVQAILNEVSEDELPT